VGSVPVVRSLSPFLHILWTTLRRLGSLHRGDEFADRAPCFSDGVELGDLVERPRVADNHLEGPVGHHLGHSFECSEDHRADRRIG
jgi:hypothetical protein